MVNHLCLSWYLFTMFQGWSIYASKWFLSHSFNLQLFSNNLLRYSLWLRPSSRCRCRNLFYFKGKNQPLTSSICILNLFSCFFLVTDGLPNDPTSCGLYDSKGVLWHFGWFEVGRRATSSKKVSHGMLVCHRWWRNILFTKAWWNSLAEWSLPFDSNFSVTFTKLLNMW